MLPLPSQTCVYFAISKYSFLGKKKTYTWPPLNSPRHHKIALVLLKVPSPESSFYARAWILIILVFIENFSVLSSLVFRLFSHKY